MELRRVAILNQIDRLLSGHSQGVQGLKSEYNRIVKNIRNGNSAAPRDILDIFPSEVWIQIVKDALPERRYSSSLLLLTMVSNKWMQTLTSVPTLWTYIEVRGSHEDSLAIVETFRRLSRDAPVHLSIYIPTRHEYSTICATLTNIGPRIREVTIRPDVDAVFGDGNTWAVLQLLLNGSQFNSSLTYIHLRGQLLYHGSTSEFMKNNPLPPSLRAIHGWNFEWRDFQTKPDYLERLEAIDSYSPIESVLSHRIQLPNLGSLALIEYPWAEFKPEDEGGFPSLQNLTSLRYDCAYREVSMRLLLCVAPQLVHLTMRAPYTNIPLLAAALQVTINLRTLAIQIREGEDDERVNERDVCPIYQHVTGKTHGLRDLSIHVLSHDESLDPEQAERRGSFLSLLMLTICGLYTKVGSLHLAIFAEYPIAFDVVLSYVRSLPELRTLHLQWPDGYSPNTEDTYTLEELEDFSASNIDVSHWFRTPNLLSLAFTWGYHRNLDNLTYADLRRLIIDAPSSSVVELLESIFPSLQELNIQFHPAGDDCIYGSFKLTSFRLLRSITIDSFQDQPQGTMLCLALLTHPSTCPSLNEIKFSRCFPDWDILFLMLEKRNFMLDSAVSLIRSITLPFIPSELCAPLASLLGGIYNERPPNNDLFMGGARELLLDEQVPGCIECLLRMMGGCKYIVESAGTSDGLHRGNQNSSISGAEFAWTEIPEYGDTITIEWMVQRKALLEEFMLNLATWRKQYYREGRCPPRTTEMEITEYAVIAIDYSWQ